MHSVFIPVTPSDAEEAIGALVDEVSSFELFAIPALGGCVVAIKDLAGETPQVLRWLQGGGRETEAQRILSALEAAFLPDDAA
jgi:hypothetical protein